MDDQPGSAKLQSRSPVSAVNPRPGGRSGLTGHGDWIELDLSGLESDLSGWRLPAHTGITKRNLILVHHRGRWDVADFFRIRELIAERAPDIEVFIADNESPCSVTRRHAARRPTLVFSPRPLEKFRPARGKIYCARPMPKFQEIRRLKAAGLPVPDTVLLEPDTRLDPATWGPLTVLKPNVGTLSRGVTVVRTHEVRWVDPFSWSRNDPRYGVKMLAQKFVDTGRYPCKQRIMAVFGRALYCERQVMTVPAPAIDPNGSGPIDGLISVDTSERVSEPIRDPEVLNFAPATAKAFPEIPVHTIDLLREEKTGKLYILEINPGAANWHLSSPRGRAAQQRYQIDRYRQFNALSVVADALIEKTRAEAE